jgi:hypothetical protein
MSIFDESVVEAGHQRLAFAVSNDNEALAASIDVVRKILLSPNAWTKSKAGQHSELAAMVLGFRVINGVGATTKLLDCGYFIQAAAILRDISEVGMLMLFFAENPNELQIWSEAIEKRHGKFGRQTLKARIADKARFGLFDEFFHAFSEFGTHPSPASAIAHLDDMKLQFGAHVNETMYVTLSRDLSILVCQTTEACGLAYTTVFGPLPEVEFAQEFMRYQSARQQIRDRTRSHCEDHFRP